jgi:hypothetical protein
VTTDRVQDIAKRFARETTNHTLEIVHDHGLYRHLKFRHQGPNYSAWYWFDLITVPGTLIFRGDGESYVFARMDDMFQFFRGSAYRGKPELRYWAEKLTSDDSRIKRYDDELFRAAITEHLAQAFEPAPVPPALLKAVETEIFEDDYFGASKQDAYRLASEFAYYENAEDRYDHRKRPDFEFTDVWELNATDYDWWFVWACNAIVWGIAKYDAERPKPSIWRRLTKRLWGA